MLASVAAMSSLTRPRGPLPPRVYWVRRLLVAGTALVLVVGVGNLLTRGSDGAGGPDRAVQVAADPSEFATSVGPAVPPAVSPAKSPQPGRPTKTPLPQPDGPCLAADVEVQPIVEDAVAGSPVPMRLKMRTHDSPACLWRVSPRTMTLRVTSGQDPIWYSADCPRTIPTRDVVLRRDKPVWVRVEWSARRSSDEGCTYQALWALPGTYHVQSAALAGEPAAERFLLLEPQGDPTPAPSDPPGSDGSPSAKPSKSGSSSEDPSTSPSGAVEPG